jgi:hypothetical protein
MGTDTEDTNAKGSLSMDHYHHKGIDDNFYLPSLH